MEFYLGVLVGFFAGGTLIIWGLLQYAKESKSEARRNAIEMGKMRRD